MTQTLSREHRRSLESTAAKARSEAEAGAAKALQALAVAAKDAPAHATDAQKKLRVRLRAHGRALGDLLRPDDTQTIDHLVTEIAYEHWHRMLFARFLAESDLLMHPDGYPVSLADCKEDAERLDPPARSEWEVAGHYAARMLPNVFRPDSPALALQLPLETEQALEALLAKLPATVFQADDSLGWSYQFWQAPKKEEVQRQMKQAGTKVGADELPAVTQLFTEQYMVAFLLENALGGWWHSRHPRMKVPVEMPYLRFVKDDAVPPAPTFVGEPAAGTFPAWPDTLAQFKLLDPCAGSGHFLVSAFQYLVPMRRATEKLAVRDAIDRVLADTGAVIRHGGNRAFYSPSEDLIQLPPPAWFTAPDDYYAVALHELTHWTGHPRRLARPLGRRQGIDAYAYEELVAEMGAAFLCAYCGLPARLEHASYIDSWLDALRRDKRLIFLAAGAAQKAVDYVLGESLSAPAPFVTVRRIEELAA